MKKGRIILTSALLAAVMSLSISMSTSAENLTSTSLTEDAVESSILVDGSNKPAVIEDLDETDIIEDRTEEVEPRYRDDYEYISEIARFTTSGGTASYITIECRFYKKYRCASTSALKQFICYDVYAQIVDAESDGSSLNADITIYPQARNSLQTYDYTPTTTFGNKLYYDYPMDHDYNHLHAEFTVSSDAFGDISDIEDKQINVNL